VTSINRIHTKLETVERVIGYLCSNDYVRPDSVPRSLQRQQETVDEDAENVEERLDNNFTEILADGEKAGKMIEPTESELGSPGPEPELEPEPKADPEVLSAEIIRRCEILPNV